MGRRAAAVLSFALLVVAARAVPAFAAPELHASAAVDDSASDNNGVLEPGESALLVVTISNLGDQDATTVAGTVSTSKTGASVTDAGPKSYGTVAVGGSGDASFGISLDAGFTCDTDVELTIAITSDQGSSSDQTLVPVPCPAPSLTVSDVSITDATTGDPVTAATVGETVDVKVQLSNTGTADATNVVGHLSGAGANITQADATYDTISKGSSGSGTFQIVPTVCPQSPSLSLTLDVTSDQLSDGLPVDIPVDCFRLGIGFVRGTWDDRAGGNGDGFPQPGETGLVLIQLINGSDAPITGLSATLDLKDADVTGSPVKLPDVGIGEVASSTEAFTVKVHDDARPDFVNSSAECFGFNLLSGLTLDQDRTSFESTDVIGLRGTLHVSSDQGTSDLPITGGATCVLGVELSHSGSPIAASGGIRFDLLWLALGLIAAGGVLRRTSLIRL